MLSNLFTTVKLLYLHSKAEIIRIDEIIHKKSAHKIICTAG